MDDNKQFWERFSRHYAGFMRRSQATYQQICKPAEQASCPCRCLHVSGAGRQPTFQLK